MRKKIICLVCCMSLLALGGCGDNSDDAADTTSEIVSETVENTDGEVSEAETTTEETTTTEADEVTSTEEDTEEETSEEDTEEESQSGNISVSDAQNILVSCFGTTDTETGNEYSFAYLDTVNIDGVDYYAFYWSWLVDGDHYSRLCDIFVSADGSAVYEGVYNAIGDCELYTEKNYR